MRNTRKILFNVIVPNGMSERDFIDEILLIETKMNSSSKLRYHLQEPLDDNCCIEDIQKREQELVDSIHGSIDKDILKKIHNLNKKEVVDIRFIPNNLEEALEFLIKENVEQIESITNMSEDSFIAQSHHSLGQFLRNEWQLWWYKDHNFEGWPKEESEFNKWFSDLNVFHADDKSSIILTCLHRKLNNLDYDIQGQIEKFKIHWKAQGFENGIYKNNKE